MLASATRNEPLGAVVVGGGPDAATILYDGSDILQKTVTGGANPGTTRYIHGPGTDEPLAQTDSSGAITGYFHADGLGSIVATTSTTGTVTGTFRYDAYGNIEAGAPTTFAYTGREWDPETGLYYYRARYYDPKVGRFISEDPIGFSGGVNFYGYVNGAPNMMRDPSGLIGESDMKSFRHEYPENPGPDSLSWLAALPGAALALALAPEAASALWVEAQIASSNPQTMAAITETAEGLAGGAPRIATEWNFAGGQLESHFLKHGAEWGALTREAYLKRARRLLSAEAGGDILCHIRSNGDRLRYNMRTNEFAVGSADGTIRTLFRPEDGMSYWKTQVGQ